MMDLSLIAENAHLFAQGVWVTITLVSMALTGGVLLGLPMAIAQSQRIPVLGRLAQAYSYVFRGTPLLVQLYILYYGLAQFEAVRASIFWVPLSNAYICALIAFTLNSAAYVTEIYRGALLNVDRGEIEAGLACGMTRRQVMWRIIVPQALRMSLPAYSNEVIFLLHASVVASTITVIDILGAGRTLNAQYYVVYEGFLTAAVLYMAIVAVLTLCFRWLERRYLFSKA